jgi:carbonic anhydrase
MRFLVSLGLAFTLVGLFATSGLTQGAGSGDVLTQDEQAALTPDQIIEELKAGNERFVRGALIERDYRAQVKATESGQFPMATVLSCLDSRVPVELVFDQGIGDIFVGRVAGNVEDETMIGSFEFATAVAGSKVIVVLGHTHCGAVKGTIDRVQVEELGLDKLNELIEALEPAVAAVVKEGEDRSSKNKDLVERAIRKNVALTIDRIRERSPDIKAMEEEGKIKIVGAIYDIATGKVIWM